MDPGINQLIEGYNSQSQELHLDKTSISAFGTDLKHSLEILEGLEYISMNDCSLQTLKNFPVMPKLKRLELIGNKFNGGELSNLCSFEELQSLSLSGNNISSIDDIKPLASLKNLIQLDLTETQLSQTENYRQFVLATLPILLVLDNIDRQGQVLEYSDDEDELDESSDNETSSNHDPKFDQDEYDDENTDEVFPDKLLGGIPLKKLKK